MLPPNYSSHAAHRKPTFAGRSTASAFDLMDPESPEVRRLLEELDDAMFAAISGNRAVLEKARELWLAAIDALGEDLVDESREQYLRYAVEVTRRFEWSEIRDATKAMAALEIIELLTKG